MKNYNLFEVFAGIGSQHRAFSKIEDEKFKINLVGTCEWDMYAVISYMHIHNMYDPNFKIEDKINLEEYFKNKEYSLDSKKISKNFYKKNKKDLEQLYQAEKKMNNFPNVQRLSGEDIIKLKVDILTYSFPCQDLSMAGKGKGMKKNSNTRSGLLWEIERILLEIQNINRNKLPKFLLLENVETLFYKNNIEDYKLWKKFLNKLGYVTFDGILNAKDFGIPQNRRRTFAISILNYNGKYLNLSKEKSINEIFEKLNIKNKEGNIKDFLCIDYKNKKYKKEALEATPNHTEYREKMWEVSKRIYSNKKFNYENVFTIMTKQDRIPNAGMIEHIDKKRGYKYRMLSPRECFRLMGFSDEDYDKLLDLNISRERRYRFAGNSIVVNVLEEIFKIFIKEIDYD